MNLQRWILLVGTAVLAMLSYSVSQDLFPKWTMLLGLAVVFLTHLIQGMTQAVQIPPSSPASKVSTSIRPPPLPMIMTFLAVPLLVGSLALALEACKVDPATIKQVEQNAIPAEKAVCVFAAEEAGLTPDASAVLCGVGVDVVNSLLAQKHQKAGSFRRAADAGADGAK